MLRRPSRSLRILLLWPMAAACDRDGRAPADASHAERGRIVLDAHSWWSLGGTSRPGGIGDVDGDGFDEVTAGGGTTLGIGHLNGTPIWQTAPGYPASNYVAATVVGGADVDGDGRDDVVAGGDATVAVYTSSPGNPARWEIPGPAGSQFGASIALGDVNGDIYADLLVAAPSDDVGGADAGRLFVYRGGSSAPALLWSLQGDQAGQRLGDSAVFADLDGDGLDEVVAAAPLWDGTRTDQGRVLYWPNVGGVLATTPTLLATFAQTGALTGAGLAAGDVNGDGFDDVLVGAPSFDGASADQGAVAEFDGSASGPMTVATVTVAPATAGMSFGASIAAQGDLDGDGFADVVVGAPAADPGVTDGGLVFLYAGGSAGLEASPSGRASGTVANQSFGKYVLDGGDTDGDGLADVVVGPGLTVLFGVAGGGLSGPGTSSDAVLTGSPTNVAYGLTVAVLDLNGDGYDDVVSSSQLQGSGNAYLGVWAGSADGPVPAMADNRSLFGTPTGEWTGVFELGDVTGDGAADLGAMGRSTMQAVFIYPASGWPTPLRFPAPSRQVNHRAGALSSGDLNCDGFEDLIIGDDLHSNGETSEGAVRIVAGSATGIGDVASWTFESNVAFRRLGASVLGVPDLDGDGCDELVVGTLDRAMLLMGAPGWPATTPEWSYVTTANCAGRLTSGDVDRDGRLDLVLGCNGSILGFAGLATGYFPATPSWTRGSGLNPIRQFAVSDLDRDGFADVAAQRPGGGIVVYRGASTGLLPTPAWSDEWDGVWSDVGHSIAAGDLNGDGYGDLVAGAPYSPQPALHAYLHGGLVDSDGDGIDNVLDCAPLDASDTRSPSDGFADSDGDTFGAGPAVQSCDLPPAHVARAGDCDDGSAAVHPGVTETCDGVDSDCNGLVDDEPSDGTAWYADADVDGVGAGAPLVACSAPSGRVPAGGDCADGDATVHPGADEVCDGADDDCDDVIDEDAIDATTWFVDGDGDGNGAGAVVMACDALAGQVATGGDCDDSDAETFPGAIERCNQVDDDCDQVVDEGASDLAWYFDSDDDGFGDATRTTESCVAPDRYVSNGLDCDDALVDVHPGAAESCDSTDEDCDGVVDDDPIDGVAYFVDGDRDGFGDASRPIDACAPPAGAVLSGDDCDDGDVSVYPGAPEIWYDGTDQDCDGRDDDLDGDGFLAASDCADADAGVNPGAAEVADDGIDQNCDGSDAEARRGGCEVAPGELTAAWVLLVAALVRRSRARMAVGRHGQ